MTSTDLKNFIEVTLSLISVFIGIILGILISNFKDNIKFDEAALGDEMVPYDEYIYEGDRVQCSTAFIYECLNSGKIRNNNNLILWIGNSQLHTINNPTKYSKTAPALVIDDARQINKDLITITQPNISLKEVEIIFDVFSNQLDIGYLILPLVFDDTRETKINEKLLEFKSNYSQNNLNHYSKEEVFYEKNLNENFEERRSFQDRTEEKINNYLSDNFEFWTNRSNIRSSIDLFLYKFRNTLFQIDSTSIRKLIPKSYEDNKISFKKILEISEKRGIKIIAYIAPIRDDYNLPYEVSEYEKFKLEYESLLTDSQFFFNFEQLVPNEYWGMTAPTDFFSSKNIDFMHFEYAGHVLLGNEITRIINTL